MTGSRAHAYVSWTRIMVMVELWSYSYTTGNFRREAAPVK